jgi:hypothetical protein
MENITFRIAQRDDYALLSEWLVRLHRQMTDFICIISVH